MTSETETAAVQASAGHPSLRSLRTPCLLLDEARLRRNLDRTRTRVAELGVKLRPHLKTAKCFEVARLAMTEPSGPAMVSTLAEAEYFAERGVRDLTYGVGIAHGKLDRVGRVRRLHGADLAVIVDSAEAARAVASWSRQNGDRLPALVEIDADGHRSGVVPGDSGLLTSIGRALVDGGAELRGVLTHAGDSYRLRGPDALAEAAERERAAVVEAAGHLRAAGLPCPVVSVGSTPTLSAVRSLSGVTEVRAGVYMFGDLFQAGVGACSADDVAISVLATVIGHQRAKGWIIVDAGWMALSRDRGTSRQAVDQGYGMVCDAGGRAYPGCIVADANQEHGIVAVRAGSGERVPELPVGALVRILPNHACATGAQHEAYQVLDASGAVAATWQRMRGW